MKRFVARMVELFATTFMLPVVALLIITGMGCTGDSGGSATPDTVARPSAATSTLVPTTTEDAVMERIVRDCMSPALPEDAPPTASVLDTCLNRGEAGFVVAPVGGGPPVVLIERPGDPGPCRSDDFILWRKDAGWQLQFATPLLPDPVDDRLLGPALYSGFAKIAPATLARAATDGAGVLMTVLSGSNSCGSGPRMQPLLFVLDHDGWRLAWDPRGTPLTTLTDSRADFADTTGIATVHVRGAAWHASDPQAEIFFESHPGPHRYVDQIWRLSGAAYQLSEAHTEPSAYNTLVNFIYALSAGDDAGASQLVADASLLDTAKQLGLVQQPVGQDWDTNLDAGTECCGPIHILSGTQHKSGPPQPVVVTFRQRDSEWMITAIAAE